MSNHVENYIKDITKIIESEDNGIGKAIHKELRELARVIKSDLDELAAKSTPPFNNKEK